MKASASSIRATSNGDAFFPEMKDSFVRKGKQNRVLSVHVVGEPKQSIKGFEMIVMLTSQMFEGVLQSCTLTPIVISFIDEMSVWIKYAHVLTT